MPMAGPMPAQQHQPLPRQWRPHALELAPMTLPTTNHVVWAEHVQGLAPSLAEPQDYPAEPMPFSAPVAVPAMTKGRSGNGETALPSWVQAAARPYVRRSGLWAGGALAAIVTGLGMTLNAGNNPDQSAPPPAETVCSRDVGSRSGQPAARNGIDRTEPRSARTGAHCRRHGRNLSHRARADGDAPGRIAWRNGCAAWCRPGTSSSTRARAAAVRTKLVGRKRRRRDGDARAAFQGQAPCFTGAGAQSICAGQAQGTNRQSRACGAGSQARRQEKLKSPRSRRPWSKPKNRSCSFQYLWNSRAPMLCRAYSRICKGVTPRWRARGRKCARQQAPTTKPGLPCWPFRRPPRPRPRPSAERWARREHRCAAASSSTERAAR